MSNSIMPVDGEQKVPLGDASSSQAADVLQPTAKGFTFHGSRPSDASSAAKLPPQHQIDDSADDSDGDSDLHMSIVSMTESIRSYRTILGRTYHSEVGNALYWGANDDKHNEAMDINHHVQTLTLGDKLFLAPLSADVKKVVDIGTGTGMWAIDFADTFPDIEVIGTDISPIQPSWVPPNLHFHIEDCTQEWSFPSNSLDYVHARFLNGCIEDWTLFCREAFRCLKPGGILESFEPSFMIESDDGSIQEGDALSQWGKIFFTGSQIVGRTFTIIQDNVQNRSMEEAGFADINEQLFKITAVTDRKLAKGSEAQGDWPVCTTCDGAGPRGLDTLHDKRCVWLDARPGTSVHGTYPAGVAMWEEAFVVLAKERLGSEARCDTITEEQRMHT